jgi:DNA-binding protein Fis
MPAPMSAYARIAKRYGVDSTDDDAVDEFFLKVVPALPSEPREAILSELLGSSETKEAAQRALPEPSGEIPLLPLAKPATDRPRMGRVSIDDRLNAIIRELIGNGITLAQAVEAFEGKYIVTAMTASKGNLTTASRKLGVHRNTLHNKLRTQTMLNGFAESVRPVRRRIAFKRVSTAAKKK